MVIFLPGYSDSHAYEVAKSITEALGKKSFGLQFAICICLKLPAMFVYPIIDLGESCYSVQSSTRLETSSKLAGLEGSWESSCQAILSLFIIFTRPDRVPSSVQFACLTTSFFMIAKTDIADYLNTSARSTVIAAEVVVSVMLTLLLTSAPPCISYYKQSKLNRLI